MAAVPQSAEIDPAKLEQFVFDAGGLTSTELAGRADVAERYVREWLNAQAAGGFVAYDPETETYSLPPEQAAALTDSSSPAFVVGLFQTAIGSVLDSPRITETASLVGGWLPALTGVVEKLRAGGRAADIGCGHGASTILMAEAFPDSTFVGSDYHAGSIETARERAKEAGVADRVSFEVVDVAHEQGDGYDLVTMFDCLHDMGDPVGAARQVRRMLDPDGSWMIVEPMAGDRVEDNLNPVGRTFYGFSTLLCTPASLSQDVGLALGAQAGEAKIKEVAELAGFTRFRRAAETPFNLVFEARP